MTPDSNAGDSTFVIKIPPDVFSESKFDTNIPNISTLLVDCCSFFGFSAFLLLFSSKEPTVIFKVFGLPFRQTSISTTSPGFVEATTFGRSPTFSISLLPAYLSSYSLTFAAKKLFYWNFHYQGLPLIITFILLNHAIKKISKMKLNYYLKYSLFLN